jgi:uncharacterized protein YoxC
MDRLATARLIKFNSIVGFIVMSDTKKALQEKTEKLAKGLYFMSSDCQRALSVHETVDLIEELRGVVADMQAEVEKL